MVLLSIPAHVFRDLGAEIGGYPLHLVPRKHKAFFGITPLKTAIIWSMIDKPSGIFPIHLLWALLLAKNYCTENVLSGLCDVTEKTYRKQSWIVLGLISDLDIIDFDKRKVGRRVGNRCLISIDGTDCQIQEPTPFSPKWFSHKFNGPGIRYEVGILI